MAHLREQGLSVLERNYRSPLGEIDLVMRHAGVVVFVEVRFRRSDAFGTPAETVNAAKREKIRAAAQHYLSRHPESAARPCRFDVVAIGPAGIEWLPDAFDLSR